MYNVKEFAMNPVTHIINKTTPSISNLYAMTNEEIDDEGNVLVSEGLRLGISNYILIIDGNEVSFCFFTKTQLLFRCK